MGFLEDREQLWVMVVVVERECGVVTLNHQRSAPASLVANLGATLV